MTYFVILLVRLQQSNSLGKKMQKEQHYKRSKLLLRIDIGYISGDEPDKARFKNMMR